MNEVGTRTPLSTFLHAGRRGRASVSHGGAQRTHTAPEVVSAQGGTQGRSWIWIIITAGWARSAS